MPFSHAGQRAYEPRPSVYMCSLKEETNSTTTPQRPRLVVSRRTCPPLSPSPHANIFIIGTAVINTVHRCSLVSRYGSGTICTTTENNQASYTVRATVHTDKVLQDSSKEARQTFKLPALGTLIFVQRQALSYGIRATVHAQGPPRRVERQLIVAPIQPAVERTCSVHSELACLRGREGTWYSSAHLVISVSIYRR